MHLRGRVAGRNKDDVDEAISMVEALAVQLIHGEGELLQEKSEVKKLANFLKQASEDAKKLVGEERAFARAEIESARAAAQRVEEALQEQERISRTSGSQDQKELMKEVQEARRIKMLHQPSKRYHAYFMGDIDSWLVIASDFRSAGRARGKEEIFNHAHARLRNMIEKTFYPTCLDEKNKII